GRGKGEAGRGMREAGSGKRRAERPDQSAEHGTWPVDRRVAAATVAAVAMGCATASTPSAKPSGTAPSMTVSVPMQPPAMDAIREDDLRRDIFFLAGDAMRGREAGTLDEMRASMWLAERAREAGLEPAGDDG